MSKLDTDTNVGVKVTDPWSESIGQKILKHLPNPDTGLYDIKTFISETEAALKALALEEALELIDKEDPQTGNNPSPKYWGNTLRQAIRDHYEEKK